MLYIGTTWDQQSIGDSLPDTILQKLALIEYSRSEKFDIFSYTDFSFDDKNLVQLNFFQVIKIEIDWLKSQPDCSKMKEVMTV